MLNQTKRDLTVCARKLAQPYEKYSIDELANAYCDAVDTKNDALKDIYISALMLRFWFNIDKMYKANTVAPSLDHEDFFWWLYDAIEYACKYRAWRNPEKNLNAQQCINQCIDTIQRQKYYNLRLDKRKAANYCVSMDDPIVSATASSSNPGESKTVGDMLEDEESYDDHSADDVMRLVQSYINRNKIIEAIIIDSIAFNDVQKHFKKTIKTTNQSGEQVRYVEHSSEFWPFRLVQILNGLSAEYRAMFTRRYNISDLKLTTCLEALHNMNNQKIYRMIDRTLDELRATYALG